MIGLSLGCFGVLSTIVMGVILPRFIKAFGEWTTAVVGLTFCTIGFAGYALAWEGWMVFVVIFIACLESMTDPALRSISAAGVSPSVQGELQGTLNSLSSITSIAGPFLFSYLFSTFTEPGAPMQFPGAPYAAAAAMTLAGLAVFALKVRRPVAIGAPAATYQGH
jgi:DHA1 family tetracycline resistance protein-like MFS transporter